MKKTSLPSKIAFLVFFLAVCHLTAGIGELRAAVEKFPAYPSIESNIAFWKDIYSKFDSSEGLIHDNLNLDIVYEVVSLEPRTKRGSRRRNKNRLKKIKNKYKYLLRKLAETQKPATKEEERVAALFGENRERGTLLTASQNIRFQRGQKDRFQKGLIRSRMHLAKIKSIFKDHGLSEDLAYLPHVESSFNYNAYSKYGAAGIWQFTYSTGKRFMTVNYTVDERWDPIRASYAAARLLKLNHQKLGDWALAITAYNHGATAMLRAQREKGSYERIVKEYNGRRFKFASRNFYSEFLAARDIAKRYEKEHAFPMIDPSIRTREVKLKGFVPVTRLTDYFKIDKASLRKLNLALREPVFRGQKYVPKGYRLRLPVRSGMDKLIAEMPSSMFESKQRRSRFYWVRKGDVAGAIARRHGITLEDLIRANNLNRRARIYAGQNLRIPSPEDAIALATRFEKRKGTRPQTTSSASAAKKLELATNNDWSKNVTASEKKSFEKMASDINPAVVTGHLMVKRTYESKGKRFGIIEVEIGETLGHYADWLGVSTQRIRRLNGLRFGKGINLDERLVVPFHRTTRDEFEEKRFEYHKEFEEDFLTAYKIEGVRLYEIRKGDNIWSLCKESFDLPVWLVKKYNLTLNFNRLMPSQKLVVPVVERKNGLN